MLMLNIYVYYISLETPLTLSSIYFLHLFFHPFTLSLISSLLIVMFFTFVYVIVKCHHSF